MPLPESAPTEPEPVNFQKTHIVDEIEDFLRERLRDPLSPLDQFMVYQEAFDQLIDHFQRHSDEIRVIKDGYDKQLAKLRREFTAYGRKTRVVLASKSNLDVLEHQQRSKYEDKKQRLIDLQARTKEQIIAIKGDLVEMRARFLQIRTENRILENNAHEQWISLQELMRKTEKKEKKQAKKRVKCATLRERKVELESEVEAHHGRIASTLDTILVKKERIKEGNARIEGIRKEIERVRQVTVQKREQAAETAEIIVGLKEISAEESAKLAALAAENRVLMIALYDLAAVNSRTPALPFDESEDPLKLVHRFIDNNPHR
jgi:chromosome segregation ATPase